MSAQASQRASVEQPASRPKAQSAALFGGDRSWSAILGQSLTWLCGGALAFNILLVLAILALLAWNGFGYFWQEDLVELTLKDGTKHLGEIWEEEILPATPDTPAVDRLRVKIGNRDVSGLDFAWINRSDIATLRKPKEAVLLERLEWGNFHGTLRELRSGGTVLATGSEAVWQRIGPLLAEKEEQRAAIRDLEKGEIGDINYEIERLRLGLRRLELAPGDGAVAVRVQAVDAPAAATFRPDHDQRRTDGDRCQVLLATLPEDDAIALVSRQGLGLPPAYGSAAVLALCLPLVAPARAADDDHAHRVEPGDTLIEATSGNTGIALAMAAAIRGYRMLLIMPEDLSIERAQTMKAFGAELVLTPKSGGMEYARDLALQMQSDGKGRVLDQFANADNPRIHYETTGPEIWRDTGGRITHFVSAMGTTGTITGVSRS